MITLVLALHIVAGSCREVMLPPQTTTEDVCVEHSAGFTRCSFGDRELTRRVNLLVEQRLKDAAQYDDSNPKDTCQSDATMRVASVDAMCEPPVVVGNVISFGCGASYSTGAHPDADSFSINLRVSGGHVEQIDLRDVLRNGSAETKLWKLVGDDIRRQRTTTCADAGTRDGNEREVDSFHFSAHGLTFTYNHYTFGYCIHDVTIPFAKLGDIVKPAYLVRPN